MTTTLDLTDNNASIIQQANLLYDFLQIELEKMRRRSIAQILCRQEFLRQKDEKLRKLEQATERLKKAEEE